MSSTKSIRKPAYNQTPKGVFVLETFPPDETPKMLAERVVESLFDYFYYTDAEDKACATSVVEDWQYKDVENINPTFRSLRGQIS
jgi:hypothetical protein